ncbi:MAG: carboxypeptidase-like regulatory domain-containing protein [Vicinamibacterales bacterium]|nr:carboxypeptidase-like regulatory domain-containing protein [Vicinamibacterales bacterium]
MSPAVVAPCACVVLVGTLVFGSAAGGAQMAHRIRGSVNAVSGAAVPDAQVRAEAIAGFRGEQFAGQKHFDATSNAKGEWTMLGLTSGVWVFEASAPGHLPQVFVLTIELVSRKPISAIGSALRWQLPFTLEPAAGRATLEGAASAAHAGDLTTAVTRIGIATGEASTVEELIAAGELALMTRQNGLAEAVFGQALEKVPQHPRALVGLASAALMQLNWDVASTRFWTARDLVARDLRPALAAVISDLQQVTQ